MPFDVLWSAPFSQGSFTVWWKETVLVGKWWSLAVFMVVLVQDVLVHYHSTIAIPRSDPRHAHYYWTPAGAVGKTSRSFTISHWLVCGFQRTPSIDGIVSTCVVLSVCRPYGFMVLLTQQERLAPRLYSRLCREQRSCDSADRTFNQSKLVIHPPDASLSDW